MNKTILHQIANQRSHNNSPWMALIGIALEHAPEKTVPVLQEILDNDRKVIDLLQELIIENSWALDHKD